jgi:hypothetical protein
MPLSFDDLQKLAVDLADDRNWLEAAVAYGSLARSGQDELGSDLATYYALNNQSVCLFYAGKRQEAVKVQERMYLMLDKYFEHPTLSPSDTDLLHFPEVIDCYGNQAKMLECMEQGGKSPSFTWMPDCACGW